MSGPVPQTPLNSVGVRALGKLIIMQILFYPSEDLSGNHVPGLRATVQFSVERQLEGSPVLELCPAHPSRLEGKTEDGMGNASFSRRGTLCQVHMDMAFEPHQEPNR